MKIFQQKSIKIGLAFLLSQIIMIIVSLLSLFLFGSAKKSLGKREFKI